MNHDDQNYFDNIQTFIESSSKATNLVELSNIYEKIVTKMGCKYFICVSSVDPLNPPEYAIVLTNYPMSWAIRHSEKQYFRYDPVFVTSQNKVTPFQWSDQRWLSTLNFDQIHILDEASEVGIREGFTVPIHSSNGYPASVSVVFDKGQLNPKAQHTIHIMSIYLYETALRMKINFAEYNKKLLSTTQSKILEEIAIGKTVG
jgi:hypothetical protein